MFPTALVVTHATSAGSNVKRSSEVARHYASQHSSWVCTIAQLDKHETELGVVEGRGVVEWRDGTGRDGPGRGGGGESLVGWFRVGAIGMDENFVATRLNEICAVLYNL